MLKINMIYMVEKLNQ